MTNPLACLEAVVLLVLSFVRNSDLLNTEVGGYGCISLVPTEEKYTPATTAPGFLDLNFTVTLSTPVFTEDLAIVEVTLKGGEDITGFVTQARPLDSPAPLGRWSDLKVDGALALACAYDNDTALGLDLLPTSSVSMIWSTTNHNLGWIRVWATVIIKETYWVHVLSDKIIVKEPNPNEGHVGFFEQPAVTFIIIAGAYVGMYGIFSLLLI